jgi:hypothetical protein
MTGPDVDLERTLDEVTGGTLNDTRRPEMIAVAQKATAT